MKSPPSRGSDAPHVHPRLRKRPPRCTLDCGFKTSESPALRGFEAERAPIRGTSLYLVLLSNGLHHPKIRLKKFGFSLKTVPANIAKKLPLQRCSKQFLIPIFNFPHKRPTFVFAGESGYTHSAFSERSHTRAYTAKQGPSERGRYHYPRSVPHVLETLRGQMSERQTLPLLGLGWMYSRRTQRACGTAMRLCVSLSRRRRGPAGLRDLFRFCRNCGLYTLGSPRKIAHKGTHGETGGVLGGGWYHYPRSVPHVSETLRGQGVERQTLPLLGLGRGCSRRTQKAFGTAMRLCVSLSRRRRGPAGLRNLFSFLSKLRFSHSVLKAFRVCET